MKKLWTTVPASGPNLIRKWERRYALTTEYAIKAAYGKLIEKATRATYAPALMTTRVQVDHFPDDLKVNEVALVRRLPNETAILDMPRYFDFRIAATTLAQHNVHLLDVAGNQSVILVTGWVSSDNPKLPWRELFEQPLITQPGKKRVALIIPIRELSEFLLNAPEHQLTVEHVYDY